MTGTRSRVLVVDDDAEVLRLLARGLGRRFEVATATAPDPAIVVLGKLAVVAIVADRHLGGRTTGIDLHARARDIQPAAARVLMSASDTIPELDAAVESGVVQAFVRKPVLDDELGDVIARLSRP